MGNEIADPTFYDIFNICLYDWVIQENCDVEII